MWKLLIVEDEDWVRMGLETQMDWASLDVRLLPSARDGVEALERIEEETPDIVLSDIRMPDMDGLRLMEYLGVHMPEIGVILISGFSDFEYARAALKHGAFGYVLKPLEEHELAGEVARLIQHLSKRSIERGMLREGMPVLRERALLRWLRGQAGLGADSLMRFAGVKPPEGKLRVALMHVDWLRGEVADEEARQLVIMGVMRRAELCLGARTLAMVEDEGELLAVLGDAGDDELERLFMMLCSQVKAEQGFSLTVGVGPAAEAQDISISRRGAFAALERRFAQGGDAVYLRAAEGGAHLGAADEALRRLAAAVAVRDIHEAEACINGIYEALARAGTPRVDAITVMVNAALTVWQSAIVGGMTPLGADTLSQVIIGVLGAEMLTAMRSRVLALLHGWRSLAQEDAGPIAAQAQRYVADHLSDEGLSLATLSTALHISPAHLCRVFSVEVGEPVTRYIMRRRVSHACTLLASDVSVREAGERVGYSNTQYFVRVFKRMTGMPPGAYRRMIAEQC